ncbi:hypothetical protein B0T17DRAFT_220384 [Bombardia bombarda]|uniref:Uncharacterized protein n=1 Tax=Bombardia bombarda TaxID=252184 RepID=A0AA40CAM2_9PEZI|nr:hypothetical protein B0T17DRAFT_220384 [Bombardia bombarda]
MCPVRADMSLFFRPVIGWMDVMATAVQLLVVMGGSTTGSGDLIIHFIPAPSHNDCPHHVQVRWEGADRISQAVSNLSSQLFVFCQS